MAELNVKSFCYRVVLEGLYLERLFLKLCKTPVVRPQQCRRRYLGQSPEVDGERKNSTV